ncbi:hypothetical protein [Acetobacter syzygii]|uniref:hypothetical protein n=1 Tax=Acetobacter syzygii TaxID=146476 RepID=UPI001C2D86F8|nr:hypothetical protein [Acetobacter syzygii]
MINIKSKKKTINHSFLIITGVLFSITPKFVHAADGQWYTGSLVSPSGAEAHAGLLGIEPYYSYTQPIGYFGSNGVSHPQHPRQQTFSNSTMWKYGITDHISIQAHTVVNYGWEQGHGHSSGPKFGDFPVDMVWRFVDPNPAKYIPAFNLFAGVYFPTGDYKKLQSKQNSNGTGSYVFRVAITEQSTYVVNGHHALRLRTWGWFRRALTSAQLEDMSSYGTAAGFHGRGRPGMSGQSGFSLEYGINQSWVLAMDLARDWANGSHVWGSDAHGRRINRIASSSGDWQIAPAVEYSWTSRMGIIVGSAIYYAGHNTGVKVSPQFAVNMVY